MSHHDDRRDDSCRALSQWADARNPLANAIIRADAVGPISRRSSLAIDLSDLPISSRFLSRRPFVIAVAFFADPRRSAPT